jgi:hypothetical protein
MELGWPLNSDRLCVLGSLGNQHSPFSPVIRFGVVPLRAGMPSRSRAGRMRRRLLVNFVNALNKEAPFMGKGDYSVRYDPDRLREMIENGWSAKKIMRELNISRYTLGEHLVMLQDRDQKVYVIKGLLHSDKDKEKPTAAREGKQGIVFSKEMLEKIGFDPGDAFEMIVEEDRIILKKIDSD